MSRPRKRIVSVRRCIVHCAGAIELQGGLVARELGVDKVVKTKDGFSLYFVSARVARQFALDAREHRRYFADVTGVEFRGL